MRSLSLVALLLASLACGPTLLNPNCNDGPFDPNGTGGFGGFGGFGGTGGFGGGGGSSGGQQPLHPAGQSLTVLLELTALPRCQNGVSRVDTEVFDGDGASVAHTSALVSSIGSAPSATVSFTPSVAGRYYVRARFEPNLGVVQRFVDVTESVTAVLLDELPTGECERVEVLASKAVLCATKTELVVRREGLEVQRLPVVIGSDASWVIAGRAVWVDDGSRLRRLLDTGTGPLVEGAARGSSIAQATRAFGTEDTLLSYFASGSTPQLVRQVLVGDTLVATAFEVPYGQSGGGFIAGGMLVSKDLVAIARADPLVCLLRLPDAAPWVTQLVRCDNTQGPLVATAGGRFWLQSFGDGSVLALRTEVSGSTSEPFALVQGAVGQSINGSADNGPGFPAYILGPSSRLLPRLTPSLRSVAVTFPQRVDRHFVARESTIRARSADQQLELFFSW